MGDLSQNQTKRVIVTDDNGVLLGVTDFTATTDDATLATVEERSDQAEWDLTPHAAGTTIVTVTGQGAHAGQTGSASFVIDPANLTVALGDPL